ncbi:PAS domain S-box protein [Halorientalis pallida]|uniref:histidine kinase n=1 Tax=Halorientalis pallida TaxID=2479928 RepID=A0A498KSU4_9EURY|nr:PAS domain S-box protein [Halorientalis pallida]RXK47706.1 PAS domain S-box protein [Halorientalis pallida]
MKDTGPSETRNEKQTDLHRTLVEKSNDVATIIDGEGTITYVSPAVTRVLGYEPEELVGNTGYEFVHPDDRERNADAVAAVLETPDEPRTVEVRFKHADGSWCWIEATMRNRLDDDVIDGILLNSREITERKNRERELRELAGEYETLLDNAEDAIFFIDVDTSENDITFEFDRLSPAYERQTGITTEEVRGETPRNVFGEQAGAELEANYHRCVKAREPISYQEELRVNEEARIWQTNLAPVLTDGDVTRLVGITRNVTDRVERERQLRSQKERLDEFASVISHDLRNPLNVAQARATLLDEQRESEHLGPLVQALDRMEAIVIDTLTLARQGETIDETEMVSLTDLVGKCWGTVDTDAATLEIADEMTFQGDRDRLRHVFENLFRNAIEHGGTDVTVRVGRVDEDTIYVEDDGSGVLAERREEIFEPGHSSKSGGTGFGLTIVKRIVEAHGWTVSVTDGPDGGARFEFEIAP